MAKLAKEAGLAQGRRLCGPGCQTQILRSSRPLQCLGLPALLLAQLQLMPAACLSHCIPIGSQLRVFGAHLERRQFLDLRSVKAHALLDLADGLQARVQGLESGLLLRLPVLPGSPGARK